MITVPTGDFVGLIADVLPFAFPKPDLPEINCVRLEWDGEMLHAVAHDTNRAGWSSWHPGDEHDMDEQTAVTAAWGGADDDWDVLLPYDDALHLTKVYKLPHKEQFTPLHVEANFGTLRVTRQPDSGHSAIRSDVLGRRHDFHDPREFLEAEQNLSAVPQIGFSGKGLADFGKVRQRGPMQLSFTGAHSRTVVRIGKRFVGSISPTEDESGRRGLTLAAA